MPVIRISKTTADQAKPKRCPKCSGTGRAGNSPCKRCRGLGLVDEFYWDDKRTGFGLKATPVGAKIYIAQYQTGGRGTPTEACHHRPPWGTMDGREGAGEGQGDPGEGGEWSRSGC